MANNYLGELDVMDISNPEQPQLTGFYGQFGVVTGLDVVGNVVYITSDWGLYILNFDDYILFLPIVSRLPASANR